ncbi:MAG: hypothetical protein JSW12_12300 [Deltaproteobacteria bacterium]|nr:MAG: hypothetical protein JSW12_12300 [Deltaproteobacteria bacterium]
MTVDEVIEEVMRDKRFTRTRRVELLCEATLKPNELDLEAARKIANLMPL